MEKPYQLVRRFYEQDARLVNRKIVLYGTDMTNEHHSTIAVAQTTGRRAAAREERRLAILAVARQTFIELGYAGTTMSEVAARLGGSKGTLWNYFPSKEALVTAVLEHASADFQATLAKKLDPAADVRAALLAFCLEFVEILSTPEALTVHRIVAGEAKRFPELGRAFYDNAPGRTRKLLASYLEEATRRGQLQVEDAPMAAIQLIGMCLAGSHMELLIGVIDRAPPERVEREVSAAVNAFMACYGQLA